MPTRIAIHGAAGRMGRRLIALASEDAAIANEETKFQVVAALESAKHPAIGQDAGTVAGLSEIGVPLSADLPAGVDVAIDFSVPDAAMALLEQCARSATPLVIATTGFSLEQQAIIQQSTKQIPIVWAPSMSLAVNVVMKLAEIAGKALCDLPSGVDVEIIERHHRFKEDAPSGTALRFGHIIAGAMGQTEQTHGREGRPGERPRNEIGYHAVRTGDNPGEHTIVFGMLGETIELRVAATHRDCYAQGALVAAQWLKGKSAGLYNMNDVLGL